MPDYQYITADGVVVADTANILTETQTEFKNAFGSDLAVTADTPQGVLIVAETLARDEVVVNNAAVANQINPNLAGGVFLDALMSFTGMKRLSAKRSTVTITATGAADTIIPAGSRVQTSAGDKFESTETIIIPPSGTVSVPMQSVEYGAIPAAVGTLTQIVDGIIGFETATNAAAAILGASAQSDTEARSLRANTLAFQGTGLIEAISSALYAVEGVKSLSIRENYNNTPSGLLINVTSGATLGNTTWALATTGGTGTDGAIVVGTDSINFSRNGQSVTPRNPWPVALYTTTGNVTLSGLGTQGGGDWAASMTAGNVVLVKNQSTASQNGVYSVSAGAWSRVASLANGALIYPPIDGIAMSANSVFACVSGGTNIDVAAALLENKSSGCGWNGGTTVNLIEPTSGQTYPVSFERPESVGITIRVTIKNGTASNVKSAIMDYVNGNINGEDGFKVGKPVSAFELGGAVNNQFPEIYVKKVEISLVSSISWTTDDIPIGLAQIATTNDSLILVVLA